MMQSNIIGSNNLCRFRQKTLKKLKKTHFNKYCTSVITGPVVTTVNLLTDMIIILHLFSKPWLHS